jgi:NAD(P)H-nitrite reductase large subunit
MKYVIIGNSAAAIGAVEGIRENDQDGEIVIISEESHHTYSRPLISYLLAKKVSENNMYYRPLDFYERNRVQVCLGEKVTRVDPLNKKVHINPPGLDFDYDKLLIATGGIPVTPECFRGYHNNLFYFHKWDDINRIREVLQSDKKLQTVVVGGGLIGLKAAESLHLRGQEVTVIEAGPYLLNSILDVEAAGIVKNYLESRGINVILSNPVTRVIGDNTISKLILEDGSQIACDLVVIAAGVKPNISSIVEAELKTDRGILVNEFLETSQPGVFAAGDVAQAYDAESDSYRLVPVLPSAYRQGKTAGSNMTGESIKYEGLMAFNSIPLLGLNIATAGFSSAVDDNLEMMASPSDEFTYRKIILKDQAVTGFIMIGDISRCGIYRYLAEKAIDVSGFKDRILANDFGLMDLQSVIDYGQNVGREEGWMLP